jgi:hypothetical protein
MNLREGDFDDVEPFFGRGRHLGGGPDGGRAGPCRRSRLRQLDAGTGISESRRHAGAVPQYRERHRRRDQVEADRWWADRRRQDYLHRGQGRADAGGLGHRHLCAECHSLDLCDLQHHHLRRERSGRGVRRGLGDALPALSVVPGGSEELQRRTAQRLDQLGLCARLPRSDPHADRAQGQAYPRHRRQRRDVQAGGRRPGRGPRWSRRSGSYSAVGSIASTASTTGCALSATATSSNM